MSKSRELGIFFLLILFFDEDQMLVDYLLCLNNIYVYPILVANVTFRCGWMNDNADLKKETMFTGWSHSTEPHEAVASAQAI